MDCPNMWNTVAHIPLFYMCSYVQYYFSYMCSTAAHKDFSKIHLSLLCTEDFGGVFENFPLKSSFNRKNWVFQRYFWGYVLPVAKEKANAKGNGDWHLRKSRVCKNVYEEIFIFRHLLRRFLVPFDFSARVCGEKILNILWGFSFSTSCRQSATKRTCVFFYCGPFCKTVRFSLLVISAAIQKRRKDRGSVLSCLGLWRGVE